MASKITGKATIFGFPGQAAIAGAATVVLGQSGDFAQSHSVQEIVDGDDEVVGLAHSHAMLDATILFTPHNSGTNTLLAAKNQLTLPTPGAVVTLSSMHGPASSDWVNTTWSLVSWKVAFRNNGVATFEVGLKRHPSNDIVTAAAAS